MPNLIHSSPLGDIDINGVGRNIPAGVPFDVSEGVAKSLLLQGDLYKTAPKEESK